MCTPTVSTVLNSTLLGTRSTPYAAAGSAAQLQAAQTQKHSARDDVTATVPDGLIDVPSGSRKRTADEPGDARY